MSIKIRNIGPLFAPYIECDTCGRQITRDEPGIVVWNENGLESPVDPAFHHKTPRCDSSDGGWEDLDMWLLNLMDNCDVKIIPKLEHLADDRAGY